MAKQLLFTLSKNLGDFKIEFIKCRGNGGQKVNKTSSGVRLSHPASGAVVESTEERYQIANRKTAFHKLLEHPKFKIWHKMKVGYALIGIADMEKEIQRKIDEAMNPKNLVIEYFDEEEQKWKEVVN